MNASPFVCPLWEIGAADLEPADGDALLRSAQSVQSDEEFVGRLAAAARANDPTYPQSEHVELQIYGAGWPSDDDVAACRRFHESPWETRLDIALGLADMRFRRLGRRLVYCERPDLLRSADRAAIDAEVARRVSAWVKRTLYEHRKTIGIDAKTGINCRYRSRLTLVR